MTEKIVLDIILQLAMKQSLAYQAQYLGFTVAFLGSLFRQLLLLYSGLLDLEWRIKVNLTVNLLYFNLNKPPLVYPHATLLGKFYRRVKQYKQKPRLR